MSRPITLFTGQWADLPFEEVAKLAAEWGYDGLEIACSGDHLDVARGAVDDHYIANRREILDRHGLQAFAISAHLQGQAVCDDPIDQRHRGILNSSLWGDGDPEGVRQRAAQAVKNAARTAARLGVSTVVGFTGSSIWKYIAMFPPASGEMIDAGYQDFADRWNPILDVFDEVGVRFALEVHPSGIAFDISSAQRALESLGGRQAFGFNYDPSHLGYQGVDYVAFIERFGNRIYHTHMKDVWWSNVPKPSGVFGGHLDFGHRDRYWDFRSLGRGRIEFAEIVRALNRVNYQGPLSIEWEDIGMDREHGAKEAYSYLRSIDFAPSSVAFDAAFAR